MYDTLEQFITQQAMQGSGLSSYLWASSFFEYNVPHCLFSVCTSVANTVKGGAKVLLAEPLLDMWTSTAESSEGDGAVSMVLNPKHFIADRFIAGVYRIWIPKLKVTSTQVLSSLSCRHQMFGNYSTLFCIKVVLRVRRLITRDRICPVVKDDCRSHRLH